MVHHEPLSPNGGWGRVRIYDESESPNDGGMFNLYYELDSPNEGAACLRYIYIYIYIYTYMYSEPGPPHEGACLRCMMSWNRQMTGVFNMYDKPESPSEGACLISRINWNRQMKGACLTCMRSRSRQKRVACAKHMVYTGIAK